MEAREGAREWDMGHGGGGGYEFGLGSGCREVD